MAATKIEDIGLKTETEYAGGCVIGYAKEDIKCGDTFAKVSVNANDMLGSLGWTKDRYTDKVWKPIEPYKEESEEDYFPRIDTEDEDEPLNEDCDEYLRDEEEYYDKYFPKMEDKEKYDAYLKKRYLNEFNKNKEVETNKSENKMSNVNKAKSDVDETKKEEGNIIIKKEIPITMFLGIIIYFNWMFLQNYVNFGEDFNIWTNEDIEFLLNLDFWAILSVIGIKKAGFIKLSMALWKILIDSTKTTEEKLNMAMTVIQQWLEVLADVSMIVASKKQ